jgi:hypothetical protein
MLNSSPQFSFAIGDSANPVFSNISMISQEAEMIKRNLVAQD